MNVLIFAIPKSEIKVVFDYGGEKLETTVPSFYPEYQRVTKALIRLEHIFIDSGYQFITPYHVPYKLLAVQVGLGVYGRNNLCYIKGLGSSFRLVAALTNAPLSSRKHSSENEDICKNCDGVCKGLSYWSN